MMKEGETQSIHSLHAFEGVNTLRGVVTSSPHLMQNNDIHWTLVNTWQFSDFQDTEKAFDKRRQQIKIRELHFYFPRPYNQSMSLGCVCKLGHLFGFLRHCLIRWSYIQ